MAPRSRTGCLTCRQRKLKCSEERPICAQCNKANRECVPSVGITFRHQQNPSMNGDPVARESLKSFYGYKETFGRETVWVAIPQELTFVHTSNPYEDEDGTIHDDVFDTSMLHNDTSLDDSRVQGEFTLSQAAYPAYATHGLEALSAVASADQYNYAPAPAPMTHQDQSHLSQGLGSPQNDNIPPSQNLDYILNPSSALSPQNNLDPRLHPETSTQQVFAQSQSPKHVRTQSYDSLSPFDSLSKGSRYTPIHDAELAFLLRDFSERAGNWMDIFDLDRFFGAHVPVLAVKCPLLLYACAALSAKSLARVDGRKPVMNGQVSTSRRSKMESWPGEALDAKGWMVRGRENYNMAMSLLRQELEGASRPRSSSALPTSTTEQSAHLQTAEPDELLAATAILCVYEFMDASRSEWGFHLDGTKSLFDVAKDRMRPQAFAQSPISIAQQVNQRLQGNDERMSPSSVEPLSKGRVAVFWNLARQDMLSAFIDTTHTRLETRDLAMWKSAGLRLTLDEYVCPSNPQHPEYVQDNAMLDEMVCNALIWLMARLVNLIATSKETADTLSLAEEWNRLDQQLTMWHEGLPDSFFPTAIPAPTQDWPRGNMEERWFARSMCASTMQSYHFARIQLLQHGRFPDSTSAGFHVQADHVQQTCEHAKEIVSIGLGRADEGARVHSVQPVYTAGLVLGGDVGEDGSVGAETELWRRTIVRQLRGIERDMGWASEYRVRSLLEAWNLPHDYAME